VSAGGLSPRLPGLQNLVVITKTEQGNVTEVIDAVRFVPMTGKAATER